MTKREAAQLMNVLRTAYPRFYDGKDRVFLANSVDLWAEMFKDWPLETVACAVKALIASDTKGFPPVIGQVMEKARELTEGPALPESEAWAMVMGKVRNGIYGSAEGYAELPETVRKALGSHETIRQWAMDECFNESVESSNFKRAYRAVLERERQESVLSGDVKRLMERRGGLLPPGKE